MDKVDTINLDIPLLIRLLEYMREEKSLTDVDLHNIVERMIILSKSNSILTMKFYEALIGDEK